MLSNIDKLLIKEFKNLSDNYWDFKREDTKGLTHGIHNYPAMMIYPISRNLIRITKKYQNINSILDPFMGSGTVLVESILSGIPQIYGVDLNPLARLISSVKTTPIENKILEREINSFTEKLNYGYIKYALILENIENYILENKIDITAKNGWGDNAPEILNKYLSNFDISLEIPKFKNIGYWFTPKTILELQIIKNTIKKINNEIVKNFIWVAFSETVRQVSNRRNGEFKMYRMSPEKVLTFKPDVKYKFLEILSKNMEKMNEYYNLYHSLNLNPKIYINNEDTRVLNTIDDDSIDLMITSPPYGDSRTTVAYGQFSRLSLQWLDIENIGYDKVTKIDNILLGGCRPPKEFEYELISDTLKKSLNIIAKKDVNRARDVYSFYVDLDRALEAITKKMKLNSYQYWVVGNRTVKGEKLLTNQIIIELGEKYGLVHVHTINRNIPNKVMPSKNSPTNEAGKTMATMTNEHIVVLRKNK